MSHHWRSPVGRPDPIYGAGDHGFEYLTGWVLSGLAVIGTLAAAWHFQV